MVDGWWLRLESNDLTLTASGTLATSGPDAVGPAKIGHSGRRASVSRGAALESGAFD